MRNIWIAFFLTMIASPAMAYPAPAGTCRTIDDGVAQVTPPAPAQRAGVPRILSMALPQMGNAVADVRFRIATDGSVSEVEVLCVSPADSDLQAAIKHVSRDWKFAPMERAGNKVASVAVYRLSASGKLPLNFLPVALRKLGA